jgi:6-phosphogluconolactonase
MKTILECYNTLSQASNAAVGYIEETIGTAVSAKGFCTIVLAGGRTPQLTYELLGGPANEARLPWQQCHFFWGDERWVPATHPDSNYFMVHNTLFSHLHIPPQNIHQIPTGHLDPETGAAMYEKHLRDFFRTLPFSETAVISGATTFPVFDLILLGMGSDGHTASLFPGSDFLTERKKWVDCIVTETGSPPVPRITLTLPVLNQARNILFLISGPRKRRILDTFLDKPWSERTDLSYPAAHINPQGRLIWLVAGKG